MILIVLSTDLLYTGPFCCDSKSHTGTETFSLNTWNICDHVDVIMADSVPEDRQDHERSRSVYRPMDERAQLQDQLTAWRDRVHSEDPSTAMFPVDDILCSQSIKMLARLPFDALSVSATSAVTQFLEQTQDWCTRYASQVVEIISKFNISANSATPKPTRTRRTQTSATETTATSYCNTLDFRVNAQGLVPQTNAPQETFCSTLNFRPVKTKKRKSDVIPAVLPQAEGSGTKRAKREALGEISLNSSL